MRHRIAASLATASLLLAGTRGAAGAALPQKEVARTLPLVNGNVSVDAYKGSIRIHAWDRAEVAVKARVVADESCDRDQAEGVAKTEVVIESRGDGVAIRADYDKLEGIHFSFFGCSARPFVHFDISLPKTAPVRVKDYKSAIHVAGLEGDLTLETYKGTVELRDLGGALDLTTYKGEVRASTALRKTTRLETYKGDVTLTIPKGAGFTLDTSLGRHARLESDLDHAARRGREAVRGGGPLLSLTSHKGEFRLREG